MPDPIPADNAPSPSPDDEQALLRLLSQIARGELAAGEQVERLIARIYKRTRKERRRNSERLRTGHDRALIAQTGRVQLERQGISRPIAPGESASGFSELKARSRRCYICKASYRDVHHFYHLLCPRCAITNEGRRNESVELRGRQAVVTGGRIKIGQQVALKLLRWGARVTITTRFPNDAARRFSDEPDHAEWSDRLRVLQADFRDIPAVIRLIRDECTRQPALDILVNNAAQSVRPSAEYFDQMRKVEDQLLASANPVALPGFDHSGTLPMEGSASAGGSKSGRPPNWLTGLNRHGELIDRRESNSWTQRLGDIEPLEILEVLLINANAPCLLTSGLKTLFLKSRFPDRYVINVTGLDGQFERAKTDRHPHVNMSKAALNMLTRTSAADYAADGIFMNSVDTGWISHEGPWSKRARMLSRGFAPPLDEVDGAARILAPIVDALRGNRRSGLLFRHYEPADW